MYSNVHKHITEKIKTATIETCPYHHIVIDNFFPDNFYQLLLKNSIPKENMTSIGEVQRVEKRGEGVYHNARYICNIKSKMAFLGEDIRLFWENLAKYMHNHFITLIMQKFQVSIKPYGSELLYVEDKTNYNLGPHTDKKSKVLTCLIYLPEDNSMIKYGTSLYTPKDKNFSCPGGPHYSNEGFDIFKTIEFLPNRMFSFVKGDKSFHGVERIQEDVTRKLLIFDVQTNIAC